MNLRPNLAVLHLSVLLASPLLAACYSSRLEQRADVLDYLYPADQPAEVAQEVRLELPLHVGVAFVPASDARGQQAAHGGWISGNDVALPPSMSEVQRLTLLERIRDSFHAIEGVERIELIPSEFLRPQGGFEDLDRLRLMLGLDLVALVSYEQTQYGDVNESALAYWTLIGSVVVPGNVNETATFVNTSVFDIASRALLFQASGSSSVDETSTLYELNEELRENSASGFSRAVDEMIAELDGALGRFREQAKSGTVRGAGTPALAVVTRPGYEGAGAAGVLEICLGLALGGATAARRRRIETSPSEA